MKRYLLFFAFLISSKAFTQDQISSQYRYTPLNVYPAIIASGNEANLILNHRNQSRFADQEMVTSTLSIYSPIFLKKKKLSNLGLGGGFFTDESGYQGILKQTGFNAIIAYATQLDKAHKVSFSLGTEYNHKRLDITKITTGAQWVDNVGFDPSMASGEQVLNTENKFLSINAGVYWEFMDKQQNQAGFLSLSVFHINRPQSSWTDKRSTIPARIVLAGGFKTLKRNQFELIPEFLLSRQSNNWFVSAGPRASFLLTGNPLSPIRDGSVDFSGRITNTNVANFSMSFNQPNYCFGFNYDLGIGNNQSFSGRGGAIELALIFKGVTKPKPINKVKIVETYSTKQVREFYELEKKVESNNLNEEIEESTNGDSTGYALRKRFYYAFNDSTLSKSAKEYLDDLSQLLEIDEELQIEIVGHSDNIGKEANNYKVSLYRAKQVADYLISKGIQKRRIMVKGMGAKSPVAPNDNSSNKALNRRVEMFIYKK